MKGLRQRVLAGDVVSGCFLGLGSTLATELCAQTGLDWVVLDLEHGGLGEAGLTHHLQAIEGTPAAGLVRVESAERVRVHRALDASAEGIMFPRIDTPEQAERAVAAMRYPPQGVRGVARLNRACRFGAEFDAYVAGAADLLLGIMQIESLEGVKNAAAIAGVDGVDVLFVGPLDLSFSLGVPGRFEDPEFREALGQVADAARRAGVCAGILLPRAEDAEFYLDLGYRFIGIGSDGGWLSAAARRTAAGFQETRQRRVRNR